MTNIKVSINCFFESLDTVKFKCSENSIDHKVHNNFIVFRKKIVYTIFRSKDLNKNHVNITGIKSYGNLKYAVDFLGSIGIIVDNTTLKVDNITGSLNLGREVFLQSLINKIQLEKSYTNEIIINNNNETFPGAFLKVQKDSIKIGTIIVFHSGKVVFVGCRNLENLKCLESLILVLTQTR
ncbi:MAG: hypothetical protein Q8O25_11870 [Sulfurisoma sp.]|nr:hypothetical protein [Sulfurisoma sp.]